MQEDNKLSATVCSCSSKAMHQHHIRQGLLASNPSILASLLAQLHFVSYRLLILQHTMTSLRDSLWKFCRQLSAVAGQLREEETQISEELVNRRCFPYTRLELLFMHSEKCLSRTSRNPWEQRILHIKMCLLCNRLQRVSWTTSFVTFHIN